MTSAVQQQVNETLSVDVKAHLEAVFNVASAPWTVNVTSGFNRHVANGRPHCAQVVLTSKENGKHYFVYADDAGGFALLIGTGTTEREAYRDLFTGFSKGVAGKGVIVVECKSQEPPSRIGSEIPKGSYLLTPSFVPAGG